MGNAYITIEGRRLTLNDLNSLRPERSDLPPELDAEWANLFDEAFGQTASTPEEAAEDMTTHSATKPSPDSQGFLGRLRQRIMPGHTGTAIPWASAQQRLKDALSGKVIGQSAAIDRTCGALLNAELLKALSQGPRATLLFVGPPGTGKRLTAGTLCEALGEGYKFLALDLSQIAHHNQTSMLMGEEPSFQDAAPGLMTTFVAKHPESVILFENVERCHPLVLARLNTLLDTGRLKDLYGIDTDGTSKKGSSYATDFTKAVLVFSTAAGESTYADPGFKAVLAARPTHAEAMLLDALAKVPASISPEGAALQFTTEMLNHWRGGRTILFRELDLDALTEMAKRSLVSQAANLKPKLGIAFEGIDDVSLIEVLLLSFAPKVGANDAAHVLATQVFTQLLDNLVHRQRLPSRIAIRLSSEAQAKWAKLSAQWRASPHGGDLLQQVRRRGLKLDFNWTLDEDGSRFEVVQINPSQVQDPSDLQGAGALRIEVPRVGFDDIAGHALIKQRLAEVVSLLRHEHDPSLREIIPRGLLLYGSPGTGKTLLARALAHEADLPFINTTGSELLDSDFTRALFARARRYAPAIVFIDEIDALGSRGSSAHRAQVLAINQLLTELDGFDGTTQGTVFVVAATNLPQDIDPALRRPGRLDLHLEVPPLDPPARGFFVDRIMAMPIDANVQREDLIRLTAGMTGAQLEQLHRELRLTLQRLGSAQVSAALLLETLNTLVYGERSTRPLTEDYMANTAIHEAGHAVVMRIVNPEQKITHINITPRGYLAGYVAKDVESLASHRFTLDEVIDELCVLLAGRNAQEKRKPGSADDGAQSDLAKATQLALAAVGRWGLSAGYGLLALSDSQHDALHQAAATEQLAAARQLLAQADARCKQLIDEHWGRIQHLQQRLLREEFIVGEDW